jgi:hypothetical protein
MKVKELIDNLKDLDQNAEILIDVIDCNTGESYDKIFEIEDIGTFTNGKIFLIGIEE